MIHVWWCIRYSARRCLFQHQRLDKSPFIQPPCTVFGVIGPISSFSNLSCFARSSPDSCAIIALSIFSDVWYVYTTLVNSPVYLLKATDKMIKCMPIKTTLAQQVRATVNQATQEFSLCFAVVKISASIYSTTANT